MKKFSFIFVTLILSLNYSSLNAQSLVFYNASNVWDCFPYAQCGQPQYGYDVAANTSSGKIFALGHEYDKILWVYKDKLIKFDSTGSRLKEIVLPAVSYGRLAMNNVSDIFILSVSNDSIIVTQYNQINLISNWSTGILSGPGSPEAFDICIAFGYVYFGFNDSSGMHLYKLNKSTGAIVSSINYNTTFFSYEHGLEIKASSTAIFVAGYLDEPGTTKGDELWLAKFNSSLTIHKWDRYYNKNLNTTNNSDRASHLRINLDTIYVCGTVTDSNGNVDAVLIKYNITGTKLWQKIAVMGPVSHHVDCAIDPSNGDAYLMQNSVFGNQNGIWVTRYNSTGIKKMLSVYYSNEITGAVTQGNSIHVDPSPAGDNCKIYISGQREDHGGDPHGYTTGLNEVAYYFERNNPVPNEFYRPDAGPGYGQLAPYLTIEKSVYYTDYLNRPNLFLLSDGDFTPTTSGFFGWKLLSYDLGWNPRLSENQPANNSGLSSNLKVFPNPASEIVNMVSDENIESVSLYNITGQLAKNINPVSNQVSFSVSDLPKGIYVLKIKIKDSLEYRRLIIE